ncbi:C-signal-like isoform X2 [Tubulanus polymorphus]|uniref:C-signal-like isoform X2 n=1 Tax=Tubulanus polymorphus TaxID=672921 RepID=UPI003DA6140D
MLSGKSILVTGSSQGIGLELVKQLSNQKPGPAFIFATCRQPDKASDLKCIASKNENVHIIQCDITVQSSIERCVNDVTRLVGDSGLNVLINNAGVLIRMSLDDISAEKMMECYKVNAVGPALMCNNAAECNKDQAIGCNRAAIVNISSLTSSISDNRSGGHYATRPAKCALNIITKSLSVDLKKFGICANTVDPGFVRTESTKGMNARMDPNESVAGILKVISEISEYQNGLLLKYNGAVIPW